MGYLKVVFYRLTGLVLFFLLIVLLSDIEQWIKTQPTSFKQPTTLPTTPPTLTPKATTWVDEIRDGLETSQAQNDSIPEPVKQNCTLWSDAARNELQCIYGIVKKIDIAVLVTPTSEDIFDAEYPNDYVYFTEEGNRASLYIVASPGTITYQLGDCIVVHGFVSLSYDGILFINGSNPDTKIAYCSDAPF